MLLFDWLIHQIDSFFNNPFQVQFGPPGFQSTWANRNQTEYSWSIFFPPTQVMLTDCTRASMHFFCETKATYQRSYYLFQCSGAVRITIRGFSPAHYLSGVDTSNYSHIAEIVSLQRIFSLLARVQIKFSSLRKRTRTWNCFQVHSVQH